MDDDIDDLDDVEPELKTKDWEGYENKLKKLCSFIEGRIKLYGYRPPINFSLLNELDTILFYIETIDLEGHFKREIIDDLDYYSQRALIQDSSTIKHILMGYTTRLNNNIFRSFKYLKEEDHGFYRIESTDNTYSVEYSTSALHFLDWIRETEPDFEVYNPVEDVINLYKCKHIQVDEKNPQNHQCKLLKGPCALAHKAKKEECPNLEKLIQNKDFFNDLINGRYSVEKTAKNL